MANNALLRATMDYIIANPEKHNQEMYADFKGKHCFAGRAMLLAGVEPPVRYRISLYDDWYIHPETKESVAAVACPEGYMYVADLAASVLGITIDTSSELFLWSNTVADLSSMVDCICAGGSYRWLNESGRSRDGRYGMGWGDKDGNPVHFN